MNYLQDLAAAIQAETPDALLPAGDTDELFLLYAVLLTAKGAQVTQEDVHNAWTAWMTVRGETHPSMVPYADLPPETRAEDSAFVEAIRRVAVHRNLRQG